MTSRWRALPPAAQDLVAASLFATAWFGAYNFWTAYSWHPVEPATWILAGAWTTGLIAVRRSAPRLGLLATAIVYPLAYGAPLQTEFHLLPILVVAYGAAASGRVKVFPAAGISMVPTVLLAYVQTRPMRGVDMSELLFHLAAVVGVACLGSVTNRQRATAETLAERNAELERLRAAEAARAVAEERTRIARELHDVVAHHLVALIVRGQAAVRLSSSQPAYVTESLPWLVGTARDALTALRQTVRVLRSDGDAPLAPQPTLTELTAISRRVSDAGLTVDLRVDEHLSPMGDQAQLAAVRITQEALTNALRHSDADRATVTLTQDGGGVWLDVQDNGAVPQPVGAGPPGHGLLHMRERAEACGGSLEIAPSSLGGWRVRAWLPSAGTGR